MLNSQINLENLKKIINIKKLKKSELRKINLENFKTLIEIRK